MNKFGSSCKFNNKLLLTLGQLCSTQMATEAKIMSLSQPGPHIEWLTLILAN